MSETLAASNGSGSSGEQWLALSGIAWEQYRTIAETLPDRPGLRIIYLDGRLALLTTSRQREWFADRLADVVEAVAAGAGIALEAHGQTTFRHRDLNAGIEGDRTFDLGLDVAPAASRGPGPIDLADQPPPTLAIEVEVNRPANLAGSTWGRLGVAEIWRFDADRRTLGFWVRRDDGTFDRLTRSLALPMLAPDDVLPQIKLAESLDVGPWRAQLADWIGEVISPRLDQAR